MHNESSYDTTEITIVFKHWRLHKYKPSHTTVEIQTEYFSIKQGGNDSVTPYVYQANH